MQGCDDLRADAATTRVSTSPELHDAKRTDNDNTTGHGHLLSANLKHAILENTPRVLLRAMAQSAQAKTLEALPPESIASPVAPHFSNNTAHSFGNHDQSLEFQSSTSNNYYGMTEARGGSTYHSIPIPEISHEEMSAVHSILSSSTLTILSPANLYSRRR
jgi:hypothetical protein